MPLYTPGDPENLAAINTGGFADAPMRLSGAKPEASVVSGLSDEKLGAVVERIGAALGNRYNIVPLPSLDALAAKVPAIKKKADKQGHDGRQIEGA